MTDMNLDDLVPKESKYLAKEDVGKDGLNLTIKGFKIEEVKGDHGIEKKAVMHFEEATFLHAATGDTREVKPLILNITNKELLKAVTGAETTGQARGKRINVFNDVTVMFGGKATGGIRIRAEQVVQAPNVTAGDFDDSSIPF